MRIINPIWKAAALSEDPLKSRFRKRRFLQGARDYLNGTHRYRQTKDDPATGKSVETGEERVMIGRIAKEENRQLRLDFLEQVRNEVPGRAMLYWKVVERDVDLSESQSPAA